jgi:hypothetical protein
MKQYNGGVISDVGTKFHEIHQLVQNLSGVRFADMTIPQAHPTLSYKISRLKN